MKFSRLSSLYLCATLLAPVIPTNLIAANPAVDEVMLEAQRYMDELSKLSPEEQEKRILADIAKMDEDLKNMTPEQRQQFDEFMSSPDLAEAMEDLLPLEEEIAPPPAPKAVAKPTQTVAQAVDKYEKAMQLLNKIIKNTNQFLLHVGKMSTFAGKVKQWYADDASPALILWPTPLEATKENAEPKKNGDKEKEAPAPKVEASTEWNSIRDHIATLVQKCEQLQTKDATNNYKYLDFLIEDKTLYTDLEKLSSALSSYIDAIAVPEFGMGELTSRSESAIRNTINNLTEAVYSKQMIKAINAIVEKYEPTAKKMREEKEKIEKKALTESKKPIKPSRITVAGSDKDEGYYGGGSDQYNQYNPYAGYNTPYSSSYSNPSYDSNDDSGATSGNDDAYSTGGGGTSSAGRSPSSGGSAGSPDEAMNKSTSGGGAGSPEGAAKGGAARPALAKRAPTTEEAAENKSIEKKITELSASLADENLNEELGKSPFIDLTAKAQDAGTLPLVSSQIKTMNSVLRSAAKNAEKIRSSILSLSDKNPELGHKLYGLLEKALQPYDASLQTVLKQACAVTDKHQEIKNLFENIKILRGSTTVQEVQNEKKVFLQAIDQSLYQTAKSKGQDEVDTWMTKYGNSTKAGELIVGSNVLVLDPQDRTKLEKYTEEIKKQAKKSIEDLQTEYDNANDAGKQAVRCRYYNTPSLHKGYEAISGITFKE